jgi:hypothetical protein
VDLDLVEDVREMRFHRSLTDEQPAGYLASGKPVEHEPGHILFAAAQVGQPLRQDGVGLLHGWRLLEPPGEHDCSVEARAGRVGLSGIDRGAAQPDPDPGCSNRDPANDDKFNL